MSAGDAKITIKAHLWRVWSAGCSRRVSVHDVDFSRTVDEYFSRLVELERTERRSGFPRRSQNLQQLPWWRILLHCVSCTALEHTHTHARTHTHASPHTHAPHTHTHHTHTHTRTHAPHTHTAVLRTHLTHTHTQPCYAHISHTHTQSWITDTSYTHTAALLTHTHTHRVGLLTHHTHTQQRYSLTHSHTHTHTSRENPPFPTSVIHTVGSADALARKIPWGISRLLVFQACRKSPSVLNTSTLGTLSPLCQAQTRTHTHTHTRTHTNAHTHKRAHTQTRTHRNTRISSDDEAWRLIVSDSLIEAHFRQKIIFKTNYDYILQFRFFFLLKLWV